LKKIIIITLALLLIISSLAGAQGKRLTYNGYIRSAKIYLDLTPKDFKKAAEMLEDAIKYYPDEPPLQAHFILGTIYSDKRLYKEMRDEFDYVLSVCDTATDKDVKKTCDKEEFEKNITDVLNSNWIKIYNDGVNTLKRAREEDTCQAVTDSLLKAECDSSAMQLYSSALQLFETSTMIIPDSSQGWINLGLIYYSIDSTEQALDAYQRAIKINPEDLSLLSNLFSIYFNTHEYDSAVEYGNKMLSLNLDNESRANVLYNMAFAYNSLDKIDSAVTYLKGVLEITPEAPDALYNLGAFLIRSGREIVDRINLLQDSVEANKAKYKPIMDSLNAQLKEKYREAAGYFEKVVEIQPDNMDALDWLGRGYFFLEQWDKSKDAYQKIIALDPENEDAWCQLLLIYLKENNREKIQEAKKHCTRYN
jgi:tetratricopeptide (TPR) repeat protein